MSMMYCHAGNHYVDTDYKQMYNEYVCEECNTEDIFSNRDEFLG